MKRSKLLSILGLPVLAFALCGCPFDPKKDDKPPDPPVTYLPQDSARNVLQNLMQAYEERNLEQYLKLFADDFTFVFNPLDVIDPENPTPPQWGLAEEQESTDNMFRNELVDKIELDYQYTDPVNSDDEYADTWKVNVTQVFLRVHTRNPEGETLIYEVNSGFATFYFKIYEDEPLENGNPKWKVWQWEDQPIEGLAPAQDEPA